MISACTERFERRLVEEVSGLRVQIAQVESSIRQDIAELAADLRQEMGEMRVGLREEISRLGSALRDEMATGRIELFKWCFLFWIGQVLAIGGLMA